MSDQLQVAIVGGGIGGLTAALALRARGLKVAIFEQAVELGETGAGISIHANAALLLQRIGLTDSIKKIGLPIAGLLLRTSAGESIDTSAQLSSGINIQCASRRISETARRRAARRRTSSWSPLVSGYRNRWPRATNVRKWRDRRDGSRHWSRRHPFCPATRDRPENPSIRAKESWPTEA